MSNTKSTEDDCSGCDALGVFKQMTGGLPNKGENNKANSNNSGSATPNKANNSDAKKTNAPEKTGNHNSIKKNISNYYKFF